MSLAGQEIPDISLKTKLHYQDHRSPPGVRKLSPAHPQPPIPFISGKDNSITVPERTITAHREICVILGCYGASNSLPKFRDLGCPVT
jgi:hypothetical protein